MLFLAVPRIRDSLVNDALKTTTRRIVGSVRELRAEAVREQIDYVVQLDLAKGAFWTYPTDMTAEKRDELKKDAYNFPAGVKFSDVSQLGIGKKSDGEVTIKLYKQGYVQPTVIHLLQDDHYFTIVLAPFLNTIQVFDKYVDITPEGVENN